MQLSYESILNVKRPAYQFPFTVSPSGRWLAYTVSGTRPKQPSAGVSAAVAGSSQWVYDLQHNRRFALITEPGKSSWSGVWSPVDDTLAFYTDVDGVPGLWLWRETSGMMRLGTQMVRPYFGYESPLWTPDGRALLVKAMPSAQDDLAGFDSTSCLDPSTQEPVTVYRTADNEQTHNQTSTSAQAWLDRYRADVARIDSISGQSRIVASGFQPTGISVSPDGTLFVLAHAVGFPKNAGVQQMTYELWTGAIDPASGEMPRCIATNVYLEGQTYTWRDDETIVYTTAGPLADGALWAVAADGSSTPRHLASSGQISFSRYFDPPCVLANGDVLLVAKGTLWYVRRDNGDMKDVTPNWDRRVVAVLPMSRTMLTLPQQFTVIVQTREPIKELYGFYRLDMTTGSREVLYEEPRMHRPWYVGGVAVFGKSKQEKLIYAAEAENEPPALYSLDIGTKQKQSIDTLNPALRTASLGTVKIITWNMGARTRRGILMLPPGCQKAPSPVIVRVYGGSMQSEQWRCFGCTAELIDNHHLFTSRGYAVFVPDLPMASHHPAATITEALDAAMHALVSQPEVDRNRIGIIGHSFGGYTALVGITRLHWFRAAVVSAGIADWIRTATHFHPDAPDFGYARVEGGQIALQDTIWDNPDRYIANSPLFAFHRIEAPVLLLQGTDDHLCAHQAGPMYAALRRLGKTAELVLYNGEGHTPLAWTEENQTDYLQRIAAWFDRFV